jgi:uncharacterized membrane protein
MAFVELIETAGKVIDGVGVAVIVGGAAIAAAAVVVRMRASDGGVYDAFRRQLGRSILLGLEFLVAADIVRTVAVTPTGESVAVLAGIVAIRTFLSFSLQVEMTGSWPWQRRAQPAQGQDPAG